MALDLYDIRHTARRTPPTFYPLDNPFPAPVRLVVPTSVIAAPVVGDELPPCRCRRCHRLLRSAPSIAAGIGPACARHEGMTPIAIPLFGGLEVA